MRAAWGMWLALCAMLAAQPGAAQSEPLYFIPTETETTQPIPAGTPARVRITSDDAERLARALGVRIAAGTSTFEYVIDAYPQLPSPADHDWLAPTFMVDYDEPAFAGLAPELEALGAQPGPAQIVALVNHIIDENVPRGWDIASQVAKRRAGDCTEHAVLTAALLRKAGFPARVTVGVALLLEDGKYGAFGHAWAERLEAGRWVVADAAIYPASGEVRYLPVGVVEDEGVGYAASLMGASRAWVSKVVVLGAAPAAAPAAKAN